MLNGTHFNREFNFDVILQLKQVRTALRNLCEEAMDLQEALVDIIVELEEFRRKNDVDNT